MTYVHADEAEGTILESSLEHCKLLMARELESSRRPIHGDYMHWRPYRELGTDRTNAASPSAKLESTGIGSLGRNTGHIVPASRSISVQAIAPRQRPRLSLCPDPFMLLCKTNLIQKWAEP